MPEILSFLHNASPTNPPPTAAEERRNLILVLLVALLALSGGLGLKWYTQNTMHTARLGGVIPDLEYPASWVSIPAEEVLWQAINPNSASTFKTRVQVSVRTIQADENLDTLSVSWLLQRNSTLEKFRNLATISNVQVAGSPAVLITYAYVADPALDLGLPGLPVVVQAHDLLWVGGTLEQRQMVVVTVAADAERWDDEEPVLQRILTSIGMQQVEP